MKRILAILLAAMMLFSLVACDTGDNPDNATLDEVSAYIDMLKADGFTYWSKYNSAEPALEFTGLENSRMYIWYGLASDGRFIEISIYEKEKTGDYRNDFGNYVDFNYNLHISLYPEKPYN